MIINIDNVVFIIDANQLEEKQIVRDEDIQDISKCFMVKNKHAYEVLAK